MYRCITICQVIPWRHVAELTEGLPDMNSGGDQGSSRIAVIAVGLFLLFDFAALALTVWLSWHIEQQAVGINLAGRQRMLS